MCGVLPQTTENPSPAEMPLRYCFDSCRAHIDCRLRALTSRLTCVAAFATRRADSRHSRQVLPEPSVLMSRNSFSARPIAVNSSKAL